MFGTVGARGRRRRSSRRGAGALACCGFCSAFCDGFYDGLPSGPSAAAAGAFTPRRSAPHGRNIAIHGVRTTPCLTQWRNIRHSRRSCHVAPRPMAKYSPFTTFAPHHTSPNGEIFAIHDVRTPAQELQCRKIRHSRRARPCSGASKRSPPDLFVFSNIFVEIKEKRPILYDFPHTFMLMATLIVIVYDYSYTIARTPRGLRPCMANKIHPSRLLKRSLGDFLHSTALSPD